MDIKDKIKRITVFFKTNNPFEIAEYKNIDIRYENLMLGYDVFNPMEFVPEYTADVGIKKGEKVDYAILDENNNPLILIEAKWCGENLDGHADQLYRYFTTTSAKFGILTNGIEYCFYTDLEEQNKMDEKPFLEINLLDLKDGLVP